MMGIRNPFVFKAICNKAQIEAIRTITDVEPSPHNDIMPASDFVDINEWKVLRGIREAAYYHNLNEFENVIVEASPGRFVLTVAGSSKCADERTLFEILSKYTTTFSFLICVHEEYPRAYFQYQHININGGVDLHLPGFINLTMDANRRVSFIVEEDQGRDDKTSCRLIAEFDRLYAKPFHCEPASVVRTTTFKSTDSYQELLDLEYYGEV